MIGQRKRYTPKHALVRSAPDDTETRGQGEEPAEPPTQGAPVEGEPSEEDLQPRDPREMPAEPQDPVDPRSHPAS